MGRDASNNAPDIDADKLTRYLRVRVDPGVEIRALRALGQDTQAGLKDYGYGRPLRITISIDGDAERDLVLRTMSPDPFGHDRRADRVGAFVMSRDTFNDIPQHIHALDVGAFDAAGELHSIPNGEGFLLTDYVDGRLYADDLHALQRAEASPRDIARAEALASYLARLHGLPARASDYARELRDTIGSGEGIFGLCDSYPMNHPIATPARLEEIEVAALRWRWRLRTRTHRARRTHGDFHPFNLLFREDCDFSVLDCSRGGVGEPADDVTCLSINFIFFALTRDGDGDGDFSGGLRDLWRVFWRRYLEESGDEEVLEVVAPFFAWRGLVVASPVWYPRVADTTRDRLLRFVERLLGGVPFHPDHIDELIK